MVNNSVYLSYIYLFISMYIHSYVSAIKLIYYRMKTLCNKILSRTGNMNNRLSSVTIAMQATFVMTYSVSTKDLLEK